MHGATTPASNDSNNGGQITLGTGFYLLVASKTVYGVRFWVPLTNTGTYTASLWRSDTDDDPNGSGTGTLLASQAATSGTLTANAWNNVLFSSGIAINSSNVYRVGVHTSSGRYVVTANSFASGSFTGDDITLYQSGSDPVGIGSMRNGVFLDAANGYPNTVFNSSDYFVEPWVTATGLSGSLGRVTVADTARPVGRSKAAGVGRVTEVSSARPAGRAKARTAGRVTVVDTSRPVSRSKSRAVGRVISPDTARSVSRSKSTGLGRVSVADSARPATRLKSAALGRVATSEAARPVGAGMATNLGRVAVADTARAVSRAKLRALGRVLVAENARGILRAQAAAIARVAEASTARNVGAISGADLIGTWGTDIGLG